MVAKNEWVSAMNKVWDNFAVSRLQSNEYANAHFWTAIWLTGQL